jgi:magnesium chelatase family protein
MVALAYTVAFEGIDARLVEVQCAVAPGMPHFSIVGLPNKAVSEAKERVRAALGHMAIALPSKRITINLSPADMPKDGSHFDLPIALSLLAALDIVPSEDIAGLIALGELSLDGKLIAVAGALPAAMAAAGMDRGLMCPQTCEAIRHLSGQSPLAAAKPGEAVAADPTRDFADVRGQIKAKRALEIAAAGRHHVLMVGSPGSGKSMLAKRLPGIMPEMSPKEALETSMIHSLSGLLTDGGISKARPFCEPHHTASMPAIVGGGRSAKPGQISLAHNGVLFMD